MNIDQLRKLIAEDRTSEVIHHLEEWAAHHNRQDISDMAALQYAKLRELEDKRLQYTASNQELEIATARLRRSLLDIVNETQNKRNSRKAKAERKRKVLLPLLVAVISIGLLAAAFTPVPTVDLAITADVDYLQFRLLEDANIDFDLYLEQFEAYNLNRAAGLGRVFKATEYEPVDLIAAGDSLKLDRLELQAFDKIAFTAMEDELQLSLLEGQIEEGKLELSNAEIFVDPIGWDTTIQVGTEGPPQIFTFNSSTASEFRFLGCPPCGINFERLPIDNMFFAYEKSIEQSVLQSAILSGQVGFGNIVDSLEEREYLAVEGLENGLISFGKDGDNISFELTGKAKDVRAGYAGQINSIKPTLLLNFYHNQRTVFYLLAAFWLVSVMWVIRRLFL